MFLNRKQAAVQLAKFLNKYKKEDTIVIGIPRGGIEIAYYVAKHLHAELAFIIAKKLSAPNDTELAIGAITEDGTVYYTPESKNRYSREITDMIEEQQKKEIQRNQKIYRDFQLFPKIRNKTVIIVDDGIATGATIQSVIRTCKKNKAERIVVAAPVCPHKVIKQLMREADDVVIIRNPDDFSSVSQYYETFENVDDSQVIHFLEKINA